MSHTIDFTTFGGNYSTAEQDTGFTWIDGSQIYKKTIDFGALPNATTKKVAHDITNFGRLVKLEGVAVSKINNYTSVPFVPANATSLCDCSVNSTHISMASSDSRNAWSAYVTVYYTKTNQA